MKIRKKLQDIGSPRSFLDYVSLSEIKRQIENYMEYYPDWNLLFDVDFGYDDTLEISIVGEREETEQEAEARILTNRIYEDTLRTNELAMLAALKAKYE